MRRFRLSRAVTSLSLVTLLTAALTMPVGASATTQTSPPSSHLSAVQLSVAPVAPYDVQLLALINRIRLSNARVPLLVLADLSDRAVAWSTHLRKVGALSHDRGLSDQAAALCAVRAIRENVAYADSATPAQLLADYLASPPHRANLLAADVRYVGIGTVTSPAPGDPSAKRFWNTTKFVGGRCPGSAVSNQYRPSSMSVSGQRSARRDQLIGITIELRTATSHPSWVALYFTSSATRVTSLISLVLAAPSSIPTRSRFTVPTHVRTSGTYTAVYAGGRIGSSLADLGSSARHIVSVLG